MPDPGDPSVSAPATGTRTSDYDYLLPPALIAQRPLPQRSASRLLWLPGDAPPREMGVRQLPQLLAPGDLLVVNQTRVLPARLRARKPSGGKVEILMEETDAAGEGLALLRFSKPPAPGSLLHLLAPGSDSPASNAPSAEVLGREGDAWRLRLSAPLRQLAPKYGSVPLPPYVRRPAGEDDRSRYQTLFASPDSGASAAAPTAGLHFDEALLQALRERGVEVARLCLQVGLGTFLPVRVEDPAAHRMHAESYVLEPDCVEQMRQARQRGGRLVAVGTTVVRALEAARREIGTDDMGLPLAGSGRTALFLRPGEAGFCMDLLLTNFHAPRSTLLMLVAAFGGYHRLMAAYRQAVARGMRFLSYGDCMLLERAHDR